VNEDKRWYKLSIEETLRELNSTRSGLTKEESETRFLEYGPNKLPAKKKPPPFVAFLRQFLSPLIYVLLIAAIISLALEHYIDAGVIMGVLLLNAVIGYIQETRAEKAMENVMVRCA
jgi:magnesium-transporting ATPase (P-type)